jgi:hypothetical protein
MLNLTRSGIPYISTFIFHSAFCFCPEVEAQAVLRVVFLHPSPIKEREETKRNEDRNNERVKQGRKGRRE